MLLIGSLAQQNAKRRRQEESEAEDELNSEISLTNEDLINELSSRFRAFSEEEKLRIRSIFALEPSNANNSFFP